MVELGALVLSFLVVVVAGPPLRRRFVAVKQRQHDAGEATRLAVRARGPAPFPRRWAWGNVDSGDSPLLFRRWHRLRPAAPVSGLTLVRRDAGRAAGPELLVVFRLRDSAGRLVELATGESTADLFERVLRGDVPAGSGAARRRIPRWRVVAAALAAVWLAVWVYLAVAGTVVPATVLAHEDGFCDVEWTQAGRRHTANVECSAGPGEQVDVLALPAPFRGHAADLAVTPVLVVALFAGGVTPVLLHARRAWRRRPTAGSDAGRAITAEVEVPRLERHDLRFASIADAARRRAAVEVWADIPPPWWARWVRSETGRVVLRAVPRTVWPLAAIVALPLFLWSTFSSALVDDGRAVTTTAAVAYAERVGPPLLPYDVEVEYQVGGQRHDATVAATRAFEEGDAVTVRYDAAHPGRARLAGADDGVPRGLVVAGAVTAVAGVLLLWRVSLVAGPLRTLRRRLGEPATDVRYVVVRDPADQPALLLFGAEGDPRPDVAVPFADPVGDLGVAGTARVHGPVEDGALLVLDVGGRHRFPVGPAVVLDTGELQHVVNGDLPAEPDRADPP